MAQLLVLMEQRAEARASYVVMVDEITELFGGLVSIMRYV